MAIAKLLGAQSKDLEGLSFPLSVMSVVMGVVKLELPSTEGLTKGPVGRGHIVGN